MKKVCVINIIDNFFFSQNNTLGILPQNALKRDFNGKCIELIEGHYVEVVVLLYLMQTCNNKSC